jgi:hypothetical protein
MACVRTCRMTYRGIPSSKTGEVAEYSLYSHWYMARPFARALRSNHVRDHGTLAVPCSKTRFRDPLQVLSLVSHLVPRTRRT